MSTQTAQKIEHIETNAAKDRCIAIQVLDDAHAQCINDNIQTISTLDLGKCIVFTPFSTVFDGVEVVKFPTNVDSSPKRKNFILDFYRSKGFDGFLHLIESNILLDKSSISTYMSKLESTMKLLDYNVHFSTTTDPCNYLFAKFCPRLTISIDDTDLSVKHNLPSSISFTSHSNVSYVTYDMAFYDDAKFKFDERFTVGMFYMIEFLARRRKTRKQNQLYYMNQYLSISDEVGAFSIAMKSDINPKKEIFEEENTLFKSLRIDYSSDNNIDKILDDLYTILKMKS